MKLARQLHLLVFSLAVLLLGFGAQNACADGIIQVAPDPCIAGEATTVCVNVCDCGSQVTSGTVNGTQVGVTTIDDNTVLMSIPSGTVQSGTNTFTLTKPDGTIGGVIGGVPLTGTIGGLADYFAIAAHQITSFTIEHVENKVVEGLELLIPDRPRSMLATGIETKKREMRQVRLAGEMALRDLERTVDGLLQQILQQHPGRNTVRAVQLARAQVREEARRNKETIDGTERRDRAYLEDEKGWMFDVGDIDNEDDAKKELEKKRDEEKQRDKDKNGGANGDTLDKVKDQGDDVIDNPPPSGWTAKQLMKIVTTAGTVMSGIVTPCPCTFTVTVTEADHTSPVPTGVAPWLYVAAAEHGSVEIHIHIDCVPAVGPAPGKPVNIHEMELEILTPPPGGDFTGGAKGPFRDGAEVDDQYDGTIPVSFGNLPKGTLFHIRVGFDHNGTTCFQDVLILVQ